MKTHDTRLIDSRLDFQAAIAQVLAESRHRVLLHDRDLSDWQLDTPQLIGHLRRLATTPRADVRLVVHDADWLSRHAPRLAELRRSLPGHVLCRRAPESLPVRDGLLIGDVDHLLHRTVADGWRARVGLHVPHEVDGWRSRFEALWDESTDLPGPVPTGL